MSESAESHTCYARHWFEYLHGRAPRDEDEGAIEALGRRSLEADLPVRELLADIVAADAFVRRATEEVSP